VRDVDLELGAGAADARGRVTLGKLQLQPGQTPQRRSRC
jgi:hypothetical protein